MKHISSKLILKTVLALIGVFVTLDGLILMFVSNFNLGNILTILLGVAILVPTLLPKYKMLKIPKWIKAIYISLLCLAVVCSSFLLIYGSNDSARYKEDAVIVLGAAVRGEQPSLTLIHRLNKAVEYHNENPDALIVVSGGKGSGENVTEAEAMEKYLKQKGVNQKKIIKEDKADSTYTNFLYSKEILDKELGENYTVAYITNEFHIWRAGLCAKEAGIENSTYMHAGTNFSYLISAVLRECLAVIKFIVFKS